MARRRHQRSPGRSGATAFFMEASSLAHVEGRGGAVGAAARGGSNILCQRAPASDDLVMVGNGRQRISAARRLRQYNGCI